MLIPKLRWILISAGFAAPFAAGAACQSTPSTGSGAPSAAPPQAPSAAPLGSAATITAAVKKDMAAQPRCDGTFSDGTKVSVTNPRNLADVPGQNSLCDFHTFAWNQFLYFVHEEGGRPRFMSLAPWYNLFVEGGKPGDYPGGSTKLRIGEIKNNSGQADNDYVLEDVAGRTVLYDIRFNKAYYDFTREHDLYSEAGFNAACQAPAAGGNCTKDIWLPPVSPDAGGPAGEDSIEVKTAWRDFGKDSKQKCPADLYYCVGDRFGLVGLHFVQKTKTHGEWIGPRSSTWTTIRTASQARAAPSRMPGPRGPGRSSIPRRPAPG